jgi:hypothetical protein
MRIKHGRYSEANSGHPGLPLGAAELSAVFYWDILKHDPPMLLVARPRSFRPACGTRLYVLV